MYGSVEGLLISNGVLCLSYVNLYIPKQKYLEVITIF